jgi:hypothetical protein
LSSTALLACATALPSVHWTLDSGASSHFVNNPAILTNLVKLTEPFDVFVGNGHKLLATHRGTANIHSLYLSEVYYVPGLLTNLLSIGCLSDSYSITFSKATCTIIDNHSYKHVLSINADDGLYKLSGLTNRVALLTHPVTGKTTPATEFSALYPHKPLVTLMDAHARMAHLHCKKILALAEKDALPFILLDQNIEPCLDCLKGKFPRPNIPTTSTTYATTPAERIHSDIWGPAQFTSPEGYKYFITFYDEFSRHITVVFLRLKSDAYKAIEEYLHFISAYTPFQILHFRSDNGGEYTSKRVQQLFKRYGIYHERTVPHSSFQNGYAERLNRTLLDATRTMLTTSKLPAQYWPLATRHFVHVHNDTVDLKLRYSPRALLEPSTLRNLDPRRLLPFGSPVFVKNMTPKGKLSPRGFLAYYVGYHISSKAILYVDKNLKSGISRDFYPLPADVESSSLSNFQNLLSSPLNSPLSLDTISSSEEEDDDCLPTVRFSARPTTDRHPSEKLSVPRPLPATATHTDSGNAPRPSELELHPVSSGVSPGASSPVRYHLMPVGTKVQINGRIYRTTAKEGILKTTTNAKVRLNDFHTTAAKDINSGPVNSKRRALVTTSTSSCNTPPVLNTPLDDSNLRQHAREKEWNSIIENETFELVEPKDVPAIANILTCRFLDTIKKDLDGIPFYKSRLIVGGHRQREGIDYSDVFAPVVKSQTIRILLAIATMCDYEVRQIDFVTAFLNAELSDEIYMRQPKEFDDGTGRICRLKKGLYGLKQAPRAWNIKLVKIFTTLGFTQLKSDTSVFKKQTPSGFIWVAVFVDDCLLIGTSIKELNELENQIASQYKIKILGNLQKIIGMQWTRDRSSKTSFLHQTDYASQIVSQFGFDNVKPENTPALDYPENENAKLPCDKEKYQQAVGSLIYLSTQTRPDIMYAVSKASEYMSNPNQHAWTNVKRIFRYLQSTKDYGILFKGNNDLKVVAYADADFAGDVATRKSRSGNTVLLCNGAVCWYSKKQKAVATSTVAAEYVSTATAAQEVIWVKQLLDELDVKVDTPLIHADNMGAISIAHDPTQHQLTKHIDIKYHYLRDQVNLGNIKVEYCSTISMIADIFTKALNFVKFKLFRDGLGLISMKTLRDIESRGGVGITSGQLQQQQ